MRQVTNSVGVMVQHFIVNSFGVIAVHAYTIGFLFVDIAKTVAWGFTTPIAVMVGQNLDARNLDRTGEIGSSRV